jgi:hypothetical protein
VSGVVLELWHGTNQAFDRFDPACLGMNNANDASRRAVFFARDPATARDYASQAARKLVPDQVEHERKVARLLDLIATAARKRDFDLVEELTLELEDLDIGAIRAEPEGARILRCRVRLENPFEIDGADRRVVVNLAGVLRDARAAGHDGVILRGIHDTPSGLGPRDDHVAVFDAAAIEILASVEVDAGDRGEEPTPDREEDGPSP